MPISNNSRVRAYESSEVSGPYWSAPRAMLYLGDVRVCLRRLPARSIHCCVTSPPYWNLRDYGSEGQIGLEEIHDCLGWATGKTCNRCFVCHMVEVFDEVKRVLRDDGTLWINLGDSYSSGGRGSGADDSKQQTNVGALLGPKHTLGIADNNIVGIPWRVALALQASGWILRQDIIWYSPNKMPESVQNRCTKSHEHIFLLAKGPDYYFDSVAIEEPSVKAGVKPGGNRYARINDTYIGATEETLNKAQVRENKNKRDVWIVPTQGYPGAHYATFSPKLITPCILAGTSEYGACATCGKPWERVTRRVGGMSADHIDRENRDRSFDWSRNGKPGSGSTLDGIVAKKETLGWRKVCGCHTDDVKPCVVLDPFVGSGTTVATSIQLGRAGIGIDINETYLRENAIPRIEAVLATDRKQSRPTVAITSGAPPAARPLRR